MRRRARRLPREMCPLSVRSENPGMTRPELIIEAGRTEAHYWRDLWRYRELFGFLAWRDVLVRYKQTAIGITWAVLRPLLMMAVVVFLRRMSHVGTPGVPDSIFI